MKKIIICTVILAVLLTACNNADVTPQETYTADPTPQTTYEPEDEDYQPEVENEDEPFIYCTGSAGNNEVEPQGFSFVYNGTFIEMDQDIDYLLAQLGEPLGVFEAPSCAFDGIDRIFGFPDIQIHTYPDGETDRVHTVSFLTDNIATTSGIALGSSVSAMLDAYGQGYEYDSGMYVFTSEGTTLSFFTDGSEVVGIIFGLIME